MAIDIEKMREKLGNLKGGGGKKDIFWKPQDGTQVIRVLPTEDGDPFKSFFFHYGVNAGGLMCPKANFGEHCAICEFVSKLFNEKDEESREMAKKLMKKQRFFSPVLVRGDEAKGPRVWGYSKSVYEYFLKSSLDPEIGDFTDPTNGVDCEIEYGKKPNKSFPDTTPKLKRKQTPICKDMKKEECEEILNKIPDFNSLHKRVSSAEVQKALDDHLAGIPDDSSKEDSEVSDIDDALNSLSA